MFAGVFPLGLLLVAVCGSELFTGNTAYMTAAVYEGKVRLGATGCDISDGRCVQG